MFETSPSLASHSADIHSSVAAHAENDHILTIDEVFLQELHDAARIAALDHDTHLSALEAGEEGGEGMQIERPPDQLVHVFGAAHVQGRGVQRIVALLPADDELHFPGFERGSDLVLQLVQGLGIDAAAKGAQRSEQI